MAFLKEHWLWIVVPIAMVLIDFGVLLWFESGTYPGCIYAM